MNAIKEVVTQTLESKGILSRTRAEIRAHVILAIEEQQNGGISMKTESDSRAQLKQVSEGALLFQLIHELLVWSNMEFTLKVFEPELAFSGTFDSRQVLAQKLGLETSENSPLLLNVLKSFKSGGGGSPKGSGPNVNTQSNATKQPAVVEKAKPPLEVAKPSAPVKASTPAPQIPAPLVVAPKSLPSMAPVIPPAYSSPSNAGHVSEEIYEEDYEFDEEDIADDLVVAEDEEDISAIFPPAPSRVPELTPEPVSPRVERDREFRETSGSGNSLPAGKLRPVRPIRREDSGDLSGDISSRDKSLSGSYELAAALGPPSAMSHVSASVELPRSALRAEPVEPLRHSGSKLEPLTPLGAKGLAPLKPLAPLAPLNTLKPVAAALAPLGPADPLSKPRMGPLRRSPEDLKEELKRTGLLGESMSSSHSQSLDISDLGVRASPSPAAPEPPSVDHYGHGGGVPPLSGVNRFAASHAPDIELSNSMDNFDARSEVDGRTSLSGTDGRRFYNKDVSMDLHDFGLSAMDQSGGLEGMGADLDVTAEWS